MPHHKDRLNAALPSDIHGNTIVLDNVLADNQAEGGDDE